MTAPKPYRAAGAKAGFAPSRAPQPRPQAPQPRAPHRAWEVAQAALERRQRRCQFVINVRGEDPTNPHRLAALAKHGLASYQEELADIKRWLRVTDRAIRERWAQVPPGVNAALADVERARSRLERGIGPRDAALKALWRAHSTLQARLFRPAVRRAA